ncbi:hypothetical protein F3Y22_tig00111954pilonHSYRG00088 [Hibiscus syriacus]|uniref:Serine-threonine/tyrosine-protein kinase catalytic domain-containing protein n=1 Tax=Hibiscus syriacus TaxID=106335 RepID=A0A6A2Y5P4_HIBSY|nr:hypothetical protein F3Y22_tig00111954pilonHSYRG00088 [Hibiscus syriacus]
MLGQSHSKFWSKKVNGQRSTVGSGQRSGRVRPVKPVQTGQTDTYNDRFKFLNGGELDFKSAESLTAPPPHAPPSTADKVDTGELGTAQGTRWCGRCRKRSNDQRVCSSLDDEHNGGFKTTIGIRTAFGSDLQMEGAQPVIPNDCLPVLSEIMIRCWDANPEVRPPFTEIVKMLENAETEIMTTVRKARFRCCMAQPMPID